MRILNVGCGYDRYGTDFIDLYPTSDEVLKVDASHDRFPYPNNTFDVVFARGMLEHLKNPENFFNEAYRTLKKGGKLVVITDNAGYSGWVGGCFYGGSVNARGNEDRHRILFTKPLLIGWFKEYNFKNIKSKYAFSWGKHPLWYRIFIKILTTINKKFTPYIRVEGVK